MIEYLIPLCHLALFGALVFFAKTMVDSKRWLRWLPCFRSSTLRVFLVLLVSAPLIIAMHPEWVLLGYVALNVGLMGVIFIPYWATRKRLNIPA